MKTTSKEKHIEQKSYQKPSWEKQKLFERFSMACCLQTGGCTKGQGASKVNLT